MVDVLRKNEIADAGKEEGKLLHITRYKLIIVLLALISAFVGHYTVVDYIITTVWMACAVYLYNKDDFFILFIPLSVFEARIFFYFTGFTVFKILLLMAFVKILIPFVVRQKFRINRYTLIFLIVFLYCLFNLRGTLGMVSLVICILTMLMTCYGAYKLQNIEFCRRAMFGFALFAIAAGIYGLLHENSLYLTVEGEAMLRFCGTSSDPNVMGSKFVIGFVALCYTDLIRSRMAKVIGGIFLLLMIFRTGSTTAIIVIFVVLMSMLFLRKASLKKLVALFVFAIAAILLLSNLENILRFIADSNFLGINGERLLNQYTQIVRGEIGDATSLRTDIWRGYMKYFLNEQGLMKQLFGGNIVNIYGVEKNFALMTWDAAPHNTNIDMFMSIGAIGTFVVYFCFVKSMVQDVKKLKGEHHSISAMRIVVRTVMLIYTFSLSMFLSYGFFIFFI